MRLKRLPDSEYKGRIKRLQKQLSCNGLDALVAYSSECESGVIRYFTGFWPFFDFTSLIIPVEGESVLLTGGPESFDFAERDSGINNIKIHPLLVETSAPEWIRSESEENYLTIFNQIFARHPRKIGVANWNIFPKILFDDLNNAAPDAEFIPSDQLVLNVQNIKTDTEIPYIEKAYDITEKSLIKAFKAAQPGKKEWELESVATSTMLLLGAEGFPYPSWVCSGDNTRLSLCRSTDKVINKNELVQFTFGAKYMEYCGNMCRPFSFGKPPENAYRLMKIGIEAMEYALEAIKPGVKANQVFDGYHKILSKYNLEEFALYGPAHGTGNSEVEGLWLSRNADFIIQPNMLFNIDIWLSDGKNGLRYEDGILTTKDGIKELTSYRREVIIL